MCTFTFRKSHFLSPGPVLMTFMPSQRMRQGKPGPTIPAHRGFRSTTNFDLETINNNNQKDNTTKYLKKPVKRLLES
jgi:hypothetical protein